MILGDRKHGNTVMRGLVAGAIEMSPKGAVRSGLGQKTNAIVREIAVRGHTATLYDA